MRPFSTYASWRRALVYGLGASGQAAVRLLRRRGVDVVGVDERSESELELGELASDPGLELRLGELAHDLPRIDGVVASPGVPPDRPLLQAARRQGVPVIAEVELAFDLVEGPVIGITGSNGKSTTTALTGAILAAVGRPVEVCGNIGRPLADCVDGPPGRVFVVELSSFQLEGVVTFRPRAAALLNLAPDHLDRHGGFEAYAEAKRRLFLRQLVDDTAVINADDPLVAAQVTAARRRHFSSRGAVADGCYLDGHRVWEVEPDNQPRPLFAVDDLPLPGPHNLENAMAAALLARAVGVEREAIPTALAGFRGLAHRGQEVDRLGGVLFVDDSKGTNPAATLRALEGYPDGSLHLILGGRAKGADFSLLTDMVGRKAKAVYLVGEAAEALDRVLAGRVEVRQAGDLDRAVAWAAEAAESGDVVLLSPACSSFDQYRDFGVRGDHFQRLVAELREGADG